MRYDVAVVGSGCFGATLAERLVRAGKKVLVVEKRQHVGGFAYTSDRNGIIVHNYGAHIFHTNNEGVWKYVNQFADFVDYIHQVYSSYDGSLFPFPPNLLTLSMFFGKRFTPESARDFFERQRKEMPNPRNAEEKGIQLVGKDLYYAFYHGYTTKHWGQPPSKLPTSIMTRLPVRPNLRSDYFGDKYQGLPKTGFTDMFNRMLNGAEVRLGYDFFEHKDEIEQSSDILVYSGPIDRYFDFCFGELNWRSLRFEIEEHPIPDYQGTSVINYPDATIPYNRIVEFSHMHPSDANHTVLMKDYPCNDPNEPIYPVRTEEDKIIFKQYAEQAKRLENHNIFLGGRLGSYQYYNMDQVIASALQLVQRLL